jgi:hypothetical protein
MKTQYFTAASVDGFIATQDDSLAWLFPLGDVNDTGYPDFIRDVGALAMGSSTYLWMLRHVIKPYSEQPQALGRIASPHGSSPVACFPRLRALTFAL